MFTQLNQYHVILEVKPDFHDQPVDLRSLFIRTGAASIGPTGVVAGGTGTAVTSGPVSSAISSQNSLNSTGSSNGSGSQAIASTTAFPNGGQVPLAAFSTIETRTAPIAINHQGQFPVVTLSFNLAPNASLGEAVSAINQAKEDAGLPASIQAAYQGSAEAFQASLANEPMLILAALVTVYIVLGVLYESYIHPITILSTLPSAGVGALLALFITRNDFSIIALIGIVLLIGIVKKNAIMMIDFALEAERQEGKSPEDAIFQACLLRFRPIMMTTMAALLGGVPLALGTGVG